MNKDLDLVKNYQKEVILLGETAALLGWDQKTYMPEEGIKSKSEQLVLLSKLMHKKITSNELFSAIKRLRKKKLTDSDKIMINKLYKDIKKSRNLPEEFVIELSKASSLGGSAWEKAKEKKDFNIFKPYLEKLVNLKRKEVNYNKLPGHPYNTLLDDFEEGMTVAKLKPRFDILKNELILLLKKIESTELYKKQKDTILKKSFNNDLELEICKDYKNRIGLNNNISRLDLSMHPFTTTIGIKDIRLTTNLKDGFFNAFGATIHECGHALYIENMPDKYEYTILRESPSMGLHESQSRFWENMIGKNKSFWRFYIPRINKILKTNESLDNTYRGINFVTPGKIRVESDEIHYCLHIILRFEIELGLIEGSIKIKDLPKIWNKKMKEYFNVVPENDAVGVLQDMHWSEGAFGYFPTYAIGTIYAAQLFNALKKQFPNIEKDIEKGDFTRIINWLKEKIHDKGALYKSDELIKKICGSGLDPEAYIKYLNDKYKEIYKF
ncbi:MAG: carboxypeptidase M32 [Nanoarchaeota archaeon]|nr:carboxypeptidase M32 [Nanoarchaeota archaeon]